MNLQEIKKAQEEIRSVLHRTPIFTSRYFSDETGAQVFLKAEMFQKTGSFKPRGTFHKLRKLSPAEKSKGIVSVSAGNYAQAIAFTASMENIPCTVVMPVTAPAAKLEATKGYGATVILHDDRKTLFDRTEEVRREKDALFLHPFDDPDLIAGHGTVGLEIFEDVPDAEFVVVGIGGGGLISGVAIALKSLNPKIRIIGVEPEGAAGMKRAFEEGKPVPLEKIETIADGLAAPYVGKLPLEIAQKYLDDLVIVNDDQIRAACKIVLERTKLLAEPAGAASVAALLSGKISAAGKKVVLMLSGGNMDLKLLTSWI
jgi:threonine dehydratase